MSVAKNSRYAKARVSASEISSRFSFRPALDFIRPFVWLADDEAIMKAVTTEANERPSPTVSCALLDERGKIVELIEEWLK
jgi:hypothetical protein